MSDHFGILCIKGLKLRIFILRILTRKMHRQVKLERLQKVQIWAFDLFDKRFLN